MDNACGATDTANHGMPTTIATKVLQNLQEFGWRDLWCCDVCSCSHCSPPMMVEFSIVQRLSQAFDMLQTNIYAPTVLLCINRPFIVVNDNAVKSCSVFHVMSRV
jgi:hypothetical protein